MKTDVKEITGGAILAENQYVLPFGIRDENGLHRIVTLKPMTGETEELIGDKKVSQNGGKVVTELLLGIIESIDGIQKITKEVVQSLMVADREFLLVMNYITSYESNVLTHKQVCQNPQCKAENILTLDITNFPIMYLEDSDPRVFHVSLPKGLEDGMGTKYTETTVRYPTGVEQEMIVPILSRNAGEANTAMLFKLTTAPTTKEGVALAPWNPDKVKKMYKVDRDFLNRTLRENKAGIDLSAKYSCVDCGRDHEIQIPSLAFLQQ